MRTKRRVEISKFVEIDLSDPRAKTVTHEDTKLYLDKIKHSVILL